MNVKVILFFAFSFNSVAAEVLLTDSGDIQYSGEITLEKNNLVYRLYEESHPKPKRFIISSPGGTVDYGIQLGEWILSKQLDIEIGDHCISSCANYVFTAGKNKILRKNSLLGWHGGLLQRADLPFEDSRYLEEVSALTKFCNFDAFRKKYNSKLEFPISDYHIRECLLMSATGTDYKIIIFGQYNQHYIAPSKVKFWSYELATLALLGVKNLKLKDGIWQPPKKIGGQNVIYFSIKDIHSIKSSNRFLNYAPGN